jgi:hypothetical protein
VRDHESAAAFEEAMIEGGANGVHEGEVQVEHEHYAEARRGRPEDSHG